MRTLWLPVLCVTLFISGGARAMAQKPSEVTQPVSLILSVRVEADGTLNVDVKVKNGTDRPVQLDLPNRQPPFDLSIFDETGTDRYQCTYANWKKDGKSATRSLRQSATRVALTAQEAKTYSLRVSQFCGPSGESVPILPGTYTLQARLGSLAHFEGGDEPVVYTSNLVQVVAPRGQQQ